MQLDFQTREMTIKLVYYGPALSGKTTNLQALHDFADGDAAGRLMTLETRDDRTLFFDLLPLSFKGPGDLSVRIKVFTVPGQVIHAATRRLVVQGADGVAFVADSQNAQTHHNTASFRDLKENLKAHGVDLSRLPLIIQFNKRDLPDIRSDEELRELASAGKEPVYLAVATQGAGVLETFIGLLHLTWKRLDEQHELSHKFGIDRDVLFDLVTSNFKSSERPQRLWSRCIGGSFDYLGRESR